MVAESKDLKSLRFDSRRALRVSLFSVGGKVLAAVKLDDEFSRVTNEICDIVLNWDLSTESSPA